MPYFALADSGVGFTFDADFPAAVQLTGSTIEIAGTGADCVWSLLFDETLPWDGVHYCLRLSVTSLTPPSAPHGGLPFTATALLTTTGPTGPEIFSFGGAAEVEDEPIELYVFTFDGLDGVEFELQSGSPHYDDPFTAMILVEVFVLGDGEAPCFWNEITNATQRCT